MTKGNYRDWRFSSKGAVGLLSGTLALNFLKKKGIKEYGMWAYQKEPTSARALEYIRKMRNPHIETNRNTKKNSLSFGRLMLLVDYFNYL